MWRSYSDIISRLGQPRFWDDNGCPRYEPFHPNLMGVYDHAVGLYDIQCQDCGAHFDVAMAWNPFMSFLRSDRTELPEMPDPKSWHYGDPPIHGCVGDTMNSIPYRIREFWVREKTDWELTLSNVDIDADG